MTAVRLCKEPLLFCKSKSPFFLYFAFVPSLLCCLTCFLPCVRVWNKNVQFAPFLVTIIISTGFQNIVSSNKYFFSFELCFVIGYIYRNSTQYNLNINNQIFKYYIYLIVKWLYIIVLPYISVRPETSFFRLSGCRLHQRIALWKAYIQSYSYV